MHRALLDTVNRLACYGACLMTLAAIVTDRFLYADGAYYLIRQLELDGWFIVGSGRQFAQHVRQSPLQLALALGVSDLYWLKKIYGATLYLLPLLSLLLTNLLLRDPRVRLLPLLSFYLATAPAFGFIISEAHVYLAAFWLLFALVLRQPALSSGGALLAITLALLLGRSYESAVLLNPPLIALTLWRWRAQPGAMPRLLGVLLIGLLLWGTANALDSVLHPRDPGNANNFRASLEVLICQSRYLWLVVLLTPLCLWLARRRVAPGVYSTTTAMLLLCGLGGAVLALSPQLLDIPLAYRSRVLLALTPLGLLAAALGYMLLPRQLYLAPALGNWLLAFCCAIQVAGQLVAAHQWHGYTAMFAAQIAAASGGPIADYRDTVLVEPRRGRQLVAPFNWHWTFPTMSVLLAPGGEVNQMIYDPAAHFQPYTTDQPPRLHRRYGVEYRFNPLLRRSEIP